MSITETARSSVDAPPSEGVLPESKAPVVEETLPPCLRLLYQQSLKGLRNLHEPFPTEWSQVYPPNEGLVYFELPFEEYGKGENPWSLVGRRMVLDWGGLDKSDIATTKKGELRRWRDDLVAKVDFSNDRKPIIQVKLGSNLQDSLQNLNDIFGALASAQKKVVGDLREKGDSLSLDQLHILQGSKPPYWS